MEKIVIIREAWVETIVVDNQNRYIIHPNIGLCECGLNVVLSESFFNECSGCGSRYDMRGNRSRFD